jgi:UPF0716 protein FxsA
VPLLLLLFIVVPIAELYVIIQIGSAIGILPTLALLLGDALLGSFLLRAQGRAVWRRFNTAIEEGRFPGREAADGVMVAVGGALLLTPGFITDVFGLLLLLPPTRALVRRGLWWFLRRRVVVVGGVPGTTRPREPGAGAWPPAATPYDIEGSAREVSPEPSGSNGAADRERPPLPP